MYLKSIKIYGGLLLCIRYCALDLAVSSCSTCSQCPAIFVTLFIACSCDFFEGFLCCESGAGWKCRAPIVPGSSPPSMMIPPGFLTTLMHAQGRCLEAPSTMEPQLPAEVPCSLTNSFHPSLSFIHLSPPHLPTSASVITTQANWLPSRILFLGSASFFSQHCV